MILFKKAEIAPCLIRSMEPEDQDFIFNSWIKSYYSLNEHLRNYSPFDYYVGIQHKIIEFILNSPSYEIGVACSEEDISHIYGYVVYEPMKRTILHYLYVKYPYRKLGIGTKLFRHALESHDHVKQPVCSHVTGSWQKIYKYKYDLVHEPFDLKEIEDENYSPEASQCH